MGLFSLSRSQTGNGAGRLRDDCREGREALSHDDDQEPAPDQGSTQEAEHRAQVFHGKVSFFVPAFPEQDCIAMLFTRGGGWWVVGGYVCRGGAPYKWLLCKISMLSKELVFSLPQSWTNVQRVLSQYPLVCYEPPSSSRCF